MSTAAPFRGSKGAWQLLSPSQSIQPINNDVGQNGENATRTVLTMSWVVPEPVTLNRLTTKPAGVRTLGNKSQDGEDA